VLRLTAHDSVRRGQGPEVDRPEFDLDARNGEGGDILHRDDQDSSAFANQPAHRPQRGDRVRHFVDALDG
jgi:hypothetical protein